MLTGKAKVAGVIGWPVGHSRSPRLHGYWLEQYGIDGAYVPLPVPPGRLEEVVRALAVAGFRGANVTIPHKEDAFRACDVVEDSARRAGAVNTLVFEDGRIIGSNTDGWGFLENLREQVPGWEATAGTVVILGAGGAARAIAAALLDAGCPRLVIVNRNTARAEALATALRRDGEEVGRISMAAALPLSEAALLVNTTPLGMQGQPPLEIDLRPLPDTAVVADIVYVPLDTALLRAARARGLRVAEGLGMLLHQGRPGFQRWFGVMPAVDTALRAHVAADIPREG